MEEVFSLQKLEHKNIIRVFDVWEKDPKDTICFVTELLTHGTLRSYLEKHQNQIKVKVVKRWSDQILQGLQYLHNHRPNPVIHRDLKCDNIFINGNVGDILIGDLGLSTTLKNSRM